MKAKFELKTWLSENRETVIAKYNELTKEANFSGITLKEFMTNIMTMMVNNRVGSAKTAENKLAFFMGEVYMNNCNVYAQDRITDRLRNQYSGTSFMAMV
jgi:hypothetical protein